MNTMQKRTVGGALMALLGLGAAIEGSFYDIGTLSQMGPGFFPVSLGVILALTGLAIVVVARVTRPPGGGTRLAPEWGAWVLILASVIAFIVVGQYGGLLPATFAIVFISALADRQNTLKSALVLSLGMVLLCVVVFWWALQLQFPLLQWG